MGLRPSPEWSARFYYVAEEFIRGNKRDPENPLFWDKVVLNMVGTPEFNPALPEVYKEDSRTGRVAGDMRAYVDDLRGLGFSREQAWRIACQIASGLQYLGIQDAPRKRRINEGPWAGTIFVSTKDTVATTVSQDKWDKAWRLVEELENHFEGDGNQKVEFKRLERVRGFLCHLAMTFDVIFPYLKGFHLTLSYHLPRRLEEGWKLSDLEYIGELELLRRYRRE